MDPYLRQGLANGKTKQNKQNKTKQKNCLPQQKSPLFFYENGSTAGFFVCLFCFEKLLRSWRMENQISSCVKKNVLTAKMFLT